MTLNLFLPLMKVDVDRRLVVGVVAAELPDRSGEIMDYQSTKPFFEKWSADVSAASGGRSMGNLRSMHGKIAAGKLTDIVFNDDAKQIEVAAKIVDDDEWAKVIEGVYTGFSQGGRYVKRWKDETGLTRYTADPQEISLVDLPCLPDATFEVVKADRVELRKFKLAAEVARERMHTEIIAKVDAEAAPLDELFKQVLHAVEQLRKHIAPTAAERLAIEKCGTRAPDEPMPAKASLRAPVQEPESAAGPVTVDKMAAELAKMKSGGKGPRPDQALAREPHHDDPRRGGQTRRKPLKGNEDVKKWRKAGDFAVLRPEWKSCTNPAAKPVTTSPTAPVAPTPVQPLPISVPGQPGQPPFPPPMPPAPPADGVERELVRGIPLKPWPSR